MGKPVVVLVGPPGAGKSTLGKRLASALGLSFIDTDQVIEQRHEATCGQVYLRLGEEQFRDVEAGIVAETIAHHTGVVSLGGGAVVRPATRQLLAEHTVVWVDVSAEEAVRRTADGNRPVLQAEDPLSHYRGLLQTREPWYQEVSDFRVRTHLRTPQQAVAEVLGYLESNSG